MTLAVAIAILGSVIGVLGFAYTRKDKSTEKTSDDSYKQGRIDQTLDTIMEKLTKIEQKLDFYDKDFDAKIDKAIQNHIAIYHQDLK